ncbi:MAG TPA: ATP-binding protein [Archangium sp.]|nr:ATP-binding protein [Archangium sp.]
MRVKDGDSVVLVKESSRPVGIVERRRGNLLTVRVPEWDNMQARVDRNDVRLFAELIYEAKSNGTKVSNSLSIAGRSTLAELVSAFGYTTKVKMQGSSLERVVRQLQRAGLEVDPSSVNWHRDDTFEVLLRQSSIEEPPEKEKEEGEDAEALTPTASLPDIFWPSALGLEERRQVAFLRALTGRAPILAMLYLPDDPDMDRWLSATWEGLLSWAFRSAQGFVRRPFGEGAADVVRGPAALLQAYLQPGVLSAEGPQLDHGSRRLNLISLRKESESPVDFARLKATWPGPIFEFDGAAAVRSGAPVSHLLLTVGGSPELADDVAGQELSPLKLLVWSREATAQVDAQTVGPVGELLAREKLAKLKGSSESGQAIALKAQLAQWVKRREPKARLSFEHHQVDDFDEEGRPGRVSRADLKVEGEGVYEVETLAGSGPMEVFCQQKVFSRLKDDFFSLVVPSEVLLWAGPFLADIAHHLGKQGQVLLPASGGRFAVLQPSSLEDITSEVEDPKEAARASSAVEREERVVEKPLKLEDIAGYDSVVGTIRERIVWVEEYRKQLVGLSRASGILFFGPPGCGKSRLARAIAGELEQDVRLLSPADLRGRYIGWGQMMIREQFDWVLERDNRMLVIDEFDAVARSRQTSQMHSDEKADVNELLVQLDRASRKGRLIVATTNYVGSLDDAVIRSGRFGLFVPVPPPDLGEAAAIMRYYLRQLEGRRAPDAAEVRSPSKEELQRACAPLFEANRAGTHLFCGADLEVAVNEAFRRCAREALPPGTPKRALKDIVIQVSANAVARALDEGPRSVGAKAVRRFLKDAQRHCGRRESEILRERLGVASPEN